MTDLQFIRKAYPIIYRFPEQFREGFDDWLWDNVALQREFEREALVVAGKGRLLYSAHTIIEYMRHYTMLADAGGEFKINEAWTSSMARLFAHMNPTHKTLLKFRTRESAVVGPLSFV
jgi:hypothetical protein